MLLFIGYTCSVAAGAVGPCFSLLFGRISNALGQTDVTRRVSECVLYLLYLSIASFLCTTLERMCVARGARRRSSAMKVKSLESFFNKGSSDTEVMTAATAITLKHIPAYQNGIDAWSRVARHLSGSIVGVVVSLRADALLTGLLLLVVVPSLGLTALFRRLVCAAPCKQLDEADGDAQLIVRDAMQKNRLQTVRSLACEDIMLKKYAGILPDIRRLSSIIAFWGKVLDEGITSFACCVAYSVVVWRAMDRVRGGASSPGNVIVVLLASLNTGWAASNILPALQTALLGRQAKNIVDASISCENTCPALDIGDGNDEYSSFLTEAAPPRIVVEGLSYSFPNAPDRVLDGVSFSVAPGNRVAVCGSSGSGKSTLLTLLTSMNKPQSGRIIIDGFDLSSVPGDIWRKYMAVVPQETVLFTGSSIFENVALGRCASLEEVVKACVAADADQFISKLPQGYHTVLDEASLSGGQRQRIGIARGFLKGSRVWLLDEWSAALDSATESTLLQRLSLLDATMISVAHRAAIIKAADEVVILDRGRVVGYGTHEELLQNRHYQTLVSSSHVYEDYEDANKPDVCPPRQSVIARSSVRLSVIPDSITFAGNPKESAQKQPRVVQDSAPRDRWRYVCLYVCSSLSGCMNTSYAIVMAFVLESLFLDESLVRYGLAYLFIGTGGLVVVSAASLAEAQVISATEVVVSLKLFEAALYLPSQCQKAWTTVLVLLSETRNLSTRFFRRRTTGAKFVTAAIASLLTGCISCWRLAVVIVATAPLHVVIRLMESKVEARIDEDNSLAEDSLAIQAINNLSAVTTLSYGPSLVRKLDTLLKEHEERGNKLESIGGAVAGGASFVCLNTVGLGLWWGARLIVHKHVKLADMMMAFLASYFFLSFDLLQLGRIVGRSIDPVELEIDEIVDLAHEDCEEMAKRAKLLTVAGAISFEAITFGYPNTTRLVLKEFHLHIPARSSLALCGASGHGKSSLLHLIQARYEPLQGRVLLDGVDISGLSRSFLVSIMTVVAQEPVVFETATVVENVLYGSSGPKSLEDAIAACKAASVHEKICGLPRGYETSCKDLGLSGGEKQRLAIARALVSPRPITILDEPTAALDTESEAAVLSVISELVASQSSTVITVAHRLSTVKEYDKIACLYRGRVLEAGTHEELMGEDSLGYYRHLYATSAGR